MRSIAAGFCIVLAVVLSALPTRGQATKDVAAYDKAVLADKPVGYWRLGEASSTDPAKDQTENKLAGKYTGGPALGKAGPLGKPNTAAEFDGASTCVDLGNPAQLDLKSGKLTIEAWVKMDNSTGTQNIVARGYVMDPAGEIDLRIVDGTFQGGSWDGQDHRVTAAVADGDVGKWVHLVTVYDGAAWRLYKNGVEAAKTEDTTGPVAVKDLGWAIGAGTNTDDRRYYKGGVAEVAIYDSALSAERIKAHYEAGKAAGDSGK